VQGAYSQIILFVHTGGPCSVCIQGDHSVCVCVCMQGDDGRHVGTGQVLQGLPGQLLLHLCAHPAPLHLCAARLP